nr:histidinol-phosphate transaminase [Legionella jordanis]
MSVLDLIRPELSTIEPYIPSGDDSRCRLHANELPWCSITLESVPLNYYPKAKALRDLQQRLSECFKVNSDELLLTRGSDDGIDLLMRVFLRSGMDSILQCPPTFPMYSFYARLQHAKVLNCPLDRNNYFNMDFNQLLSVWEPNCKLLMLCRPNNPTGNLLELGAIARLCEQFRDKAIVVVDEAYIEFSESASATTLLPSYDNLIVLRTLSKAYGLAGLRLGAICAQKQVIKALHNCMAPYSISSAVMALAQNALRDMSWFSQRLQRILAEKNKLYEQLQSCAWITTVYPSHANFILIRSPYAEALMNTFARAGIAVRYFTNPPLENTLRITVGDEQHNQELLMLLSAFKPGEMQ